MKRLLEDDFLAAITNGDITTVKRIIRENNFPVDLVLNSGWTPLLHAAHLFKALICEYLLESGANVEFQSNYMTPLLLLSSHKPLLEEETPCLNCAKVLFTFGANVNVSDKFQTSPLHYAVINQNYPLLNLFIENGANVNHLDSRGFNALHHACYHGNYEIAIKLIESGCNYNLINHSGCTPIDVAYAHGFSDLGTFMDSGCKGIAPKTPKELADGSNVVSKQLSDLELFLAGLDLMDLLPLLQDENRITFKQLLTLTDSELEKLGIAQMGSRKKILNGVHEVNKKHWKTESFPHTCEFSRYLSSTEANSLLKNISSHTEYMNSSVVYLRKQIANDPTVFLSSYKVDNTLTNVMQTVSGTLDQFREIYHQLDLLNSNLVDLMHKVPESDRDKLVDQLPPIDFQNKPAFWGRNLLLPTSIFCLLTSFGFMFLAKHNVKLFTNFRTSLK